MNDAIQNLLTLHEVTLAYGKKTVVDRVSLSVPSGPYGLGLIGESGSGKTTIARAVLGLIPIRSGKIAVEGVELSRMSRPERRRYRRIVQPVFQDGTEILDPRMTVRQSLREALKVAGQPANADHVAELLDDVGLAASLADVHPHQLSGGQRQRVAIARALATRPGLLILDEPTSALDTTVQAKVLDLLVRLKHERNLAFLLITHNLTIVERLCDDAAVISAGSIVEQAPAAQLLSDPEHPYTRQLIDAVPRLKRDF